MEQVKGIDISELISAPLIGALNANYKMQNATANFIKNNCFELDDDGKLQAIMLKFGYKYPINKQDGKIENIESSIHAPLISIINIPNLAVKKVTVHFNMEVKTTTLESEKSSTDIGAEIGSKSIWSPISAKITGSISSSEKNQRSTDTSSRYTIHIEAGDTAQAEGLSRLIDILNNSIPDQTMSKTKKE